MTLQQKIVGDVLVDDAVFRLPDQAVVSNGHFVVVVLNDQTRLGFFAERHMQIMVDALGANAFRSQQLAILFRLLKQVFEAFFGFDSDGDTTLPGPLLDDEGLVVLGLQGLDLNLEKLGTHINTL